MGDHGDQRMADRAEASPRQLRAVLAGRVVQRGEDDVERREDGVRAVERAVGQDVDLEAVQDRHARRLVAQPRRSRRAAARARSSVTVRDGAGVLGVIGDRDVLVAERMRRPGSSAAASRARRCRWCACGGRRGCLRAAPASAPPGAARGRARRARRASPAADRRGRRWCRPRSRTRSGEVRGASGRRRRARPGRSW